YGEQLYSPSIVIPQNTPRGTYHVGVILDWDNRLVERYEGDNVARLGVITITDPPTPPDLSIEGLQVSNARAARGATVTVTGTIRNLGSTYAGPFDTVVSLTSHGGDPVDAWLVGLATQNLGLNGNASTPLSVQVAIPDELCAERTWHLRATADWADSVTERNEDNNWQQIPITPSWDTAAGYKFGATLRLVHTSKPSVFTMCAKAQQVAHQDIWYLTLMTCSGTTPGIPLGPLGTLPLNYDACTEIGLAIHGSYLNAIGPLENSAQGSRIDFLGGAWLLPGKNVTLHFATLFLDIKTQSFVGIAKNAVECGIVD
nr:CARDB domain-containing protein [Planctomycetota bacterium]